VIREVDVVRLKSVVEQVITANLHVIFGSDISVVVNEEDVLVILSPGVTELNLHFLEVESGASPSELVLVTSHVG